jgi:hypothetical protein
MCFCPVICWQHKTKTTPGVVFDPGASVYLKAFQPLVEYPIFRALQQTFCNHYRRAAPNVNIFNFFHCRIGLDGRNFQFGALGALGIDVGAVSGGWGGTL